MKTQIKPTKEWGSKARKEEGKNVKKADKKAAIKEGRADAGR